MNVIDDLLTRKIPVSSLRATLIQQNSLNWVATLLEKAIMNFDYELLEEYMNVIHPSRNTPAGFNGCYGLTPSSTLFNMAKNHFEVMVRKAKQTNRLDDFRKILRK